MKRYNRSWHLFLESVQGGVSNLKFGELTRPMFVKMLGEKMRLIAASPEDIPEHPFPKNDSEEVRREIEHIIKKAKESPFDNKELIMLDKRATNSFFEFMDAEGVQYDKDFLKELSDDTSRFALKLKMKYQRPRPKQLAPLLGYEITDIPTSTDDSPSYPSGHALVAWTLALYLSDKNPEHKEGFYDLAGKIEDSRIIRGAHFLSDNVFAKLVARKYVVPSIKE
jgi:hypothetical protein